MTRIPGDVTRTLDQYTWLVHWTRTLDSYTRDAVLHYYYLHALRITQFKTIFLVYECTLSRTRMEMHQLHQLHGQFMFVMAALVRKFNPGLVPLSFAEKDQRCVSPVFSYQWLAKWGMGRARHQERASCTALGDLYAHELKTSRLVVWNWQAAVVLQMGDTRIITIAGHCITTPFLYVVERLLLWDVQALLALLDCYVHSRLWETWTVAAVSLPGPSGRQLSLLDCSKAAQV